MQRSGSRCATSAGLRAGRVPARALARTAAVVLTGILSAGVAGAQTAPKLTGTLQELRERADQLFEQERFDEARDGYLQIHAAFAQDPRLNRNLGTAYFRATQPNLRQAIRYWTLSWQIDGNEGLMGETAQAHVRLGQWEAGARIWADAARAHAQHPEHWRQAAEIAEAAQRYGPAATWYREYLTRRPAEHEVRLTLARLLSWDKQFEAAEREYTRVLAAQPRNLVARLAIAQLLAWRGAHADSIARYDAILRDQPGNVDAQRGKAFAVLWMGDVATAKPLFQSLARHRPGDREVRTALTDIAAAERAAAEAPPPPPPDPVAPFRGRIDEALRAGDAVAALIAVREGLAVTPGDASLRRRQAQALLAQDDTAGAIAVLTALRDERPDDADVLRELAWAEMRAGTLDAAMTTLTAYLAKRPDDLAARVDRARILSWTQKFGEAATEYRAVLAADPIDIDSLVGLAQVDAWQARYEPALAQFEDILRRWPEQREALLGRAQALFWVGRRAEALERVAALTVALPADREVAALAESLRAAEREAAAAEAARATAAAVAPVDGVLEGHRTRAQELTAVRKYAEAVAEYDMLLTRAPDDLDGRLQRARILSWDRQYERALAGYRDVLARAPESREAKIEQARVLSWRGDLTQAIAIFAEMQARFPDDRDVLLGKGQALQWSGRPTEAEKLLLPLRERFPDDRDIRVALAGTQLALGRTDRALQELEAAGGSSSDHADVQLLRALVLQQLRPVFVLNYSPSRDSDELEIRPWSGTLYFTTHPRVRSYVRGLWTPSQTPVLGQARGREAVFGSTLQLSPQILVRGEAGTNVGANRRTSAIGGGGISWLPVQAFRLDIAADRAFLNYLPLAVQRDISRVQARLGLDYRPIRRLALRLDASHNRYSDDNRAHSGAFSATQTLVRRDPFTLESGYAYTINGFAEDPGNGYYAPSSLQRHAALVNVHGRLSPWAGYSVSATYGAEQTAGDPFRPDGTARASLDFSIGRVLKVSGGYGYFRVANVNRSSAYLTHSAFGGVEVRF